MDLVAAMPWWVPQTFGDIAFIAIVLFMELWILGMWWAFGPGGDDRLGAWEARRKQRKKADGDG